MRIPKAVYIWTPLDHKFILYFDILLLSEAMTVCDYTANSFCEQGIAHIPIQCRAPKSVGLNKRALIGIS